MDHSCAERVIVGRALQDAWIGDDGTLWVGNGEYESQVNYCPWCGMPALTPVSLEEVTAASRRANLIAALGKMESSGTLIDRDRALLTALRAES